MKKNPFLLFLLILSNISISQQYQPFPTSDAIWREDYHHIYGSSQNEYDQYQYFLNGDTLIQKNIFKNLQNWLVSAYVAC